MREAFEASWTFVRFLSAVNTQVLLEMMLVLESLSTLSTLKLAIPRCVRQHVTLQSVNVHKGLIANVADLVAPWHMRGHMTL